MGELFNRVTRQEWREELASLFADGDSLWRCKDPYTKAESYIARGKPIPVWVGAAMLEEKKPKKMGRHAHPEEKARQLASDMACFFAVEDLVKNDGLKQTPAEVKTGKAFNLSRQAVHSSWERHRIRLEALRILEILRSKKSKAT